MCSLVSSSWFIAPYPCDWCLYLRYPSWLMTITACVRSVLSAVQIPRDMDVWMGGEGMRRY